MAFDPVSAALDIGGKVIDRVWPDPAQKDAAEEELLGDRRGNHGGDDDDRDRAELVERALE